MRINKGEIGEICIKSGQEVEWSIDEFCSYTVEDHYYTSPRFTISGSQWYLEVCPNGETADDSVGWISLYLMRDDGDESPPISARYNFGIKKVDGSVEHIAGEFTWVFEEDGRGLGCPKILKRSELQQRPVLLGSGHTQSALERHESLLPRLSPLSPLVEYECFNFDPPDEAEAENVDVIFVRAMYVPKFSDNASETLTLTCTLWTGKHFEACGSLDTLSRNFGDLFTSKKCSDASLVVQGKEFPVHKLVLSARSPVLADMFEGKEKATGLVEIPDFDPETFKEFLTFLYSGKVENDSCDAFELYRIADEYDVQDLMSECVISIMTNLSVENVLEAAVFANQFNKNALMQKVENFFKENCDEIITSNKWDDDFLSENATVVNKLLKAMAKK